MEALLKKIDEIMAKDIVRKLGGFVCFVIVILSLAGFFIGAGSLLGSMKKPAADVEISEEDGEAAEAEAEEGDEEGDEEADEEEEHEE
jgi:hypothetical protein